MFVLASNFTGLLEGLFAINTAALALAIVGLGVQRRLQKQRKSILLRVVLAIPPILLAGLLTLIHFRDDPPDFVWFRVLSGSALFISLAAAVFWRPAAAIP